MKRIAIMVLVLMAATSAFAAEPLERKAQPRFYGAKFDSAHAYNVQRYTMWIGLPFTNDSLYGHVRIDAVKSAAVDSIVLNSVRLEIDSVELNGNPAGFARTADTLSLKIDVAALVPGDHFFLDVFYRGGNFSKNGTGPDGSSSWGYYWYPRGYNGGTLHAIGYSMSEPQEARCRVPCFDEQWDKADSGCAFYVTVPDSYQVASNGLLQDTVRSGGQLTWHWVQPAPIATYLMCFTASRYASWIDTAHTVNAGSIPLDYFIWPEDSAASRAAFATVPGMVRLYDSLFHAYPFDKYGMAAAYPFGFGGMEHQTMTTIHRNWITVSEQRGIAHELAHMWYGDLVTCGGWADIWLNEGFASYLEAVYDEHHNNRPPGAYMQQRFYSALGSNANYHPVYDPPPALLFDFSMIYSKGAWVLQGLRGVMGDGAFFAGMRAYADSFAYGNAVTADYQRIMERNCGSSLQWYFDEWLHRAGHPRYTTVVYYKTHPDSNAARVLIKQASITGESYTMPLQLACSTRAGLSTMTVWDSTARAGDFLVNDTLPVLSITLDRDNWVLKEWFDSLPHMAQLSTYTKTGGAVIASWNRFNVDSSISGYHLYRGPSSSGPFTRVDAGIITDTSFVDTNADSGSVWYYCVTAVDGADTACQTHFSNVLSGTAGGVSGQPGWAAPGPFSLTQNRPNPFKHSTTVNYQLPEASQVTLGVYNATGQLIRTLVNAQQRAGLHVAVWDGRDAGGRPVASGVYLCRLETARGALVKAMQRVK